MRKSMIGLATAVAVAALGLAACGSNGDGGGGEATSGTTAQEVTQGYNGEAAEISFTWWGNDDRAQRYEQALALFSEEYPEITVVRNFSSWGDYWTARNTEAAGRALPDVMQMDVGYIGQYGGKDLLLDLARYADETIGRSGHGEALLASGTINGEIVGVPLGSGVWSLMFNKDMLDELGVDYPTGDMTWEEFEAYSREVNEAGASHDPSFYGAEDFTGGLPGFMYDQMQHGGTVFDESGQPAFTEDDVVTYLETGKAMRADDAFYPVDRAAALAPLGGFTGGEAATWFNWSTTLLQGMTDIGTENLGQVAPPVPTDPADRVLAEKPSMLLSVAANSKSPAAAAVLVDFLATSPEVAAIFGTSLGTPATQAGRDAIAMNPADETILAYLDTVADQTTASYPLLPSGYGSVEAKWAELHEELRYGNLTEEQFAASLFEEMSLTLGK